MSGDVDVDFFEKSLNEAGLTGAEVAHYDDPARMQETIQVRKIVGGEKIGVDQTINHRQLAQMDDPKQHLARLAEETVRQFDDYLTEHHKWGRKSVKLDLKEDIKATCHMCGSEVSIEDQLERAGASLSETAVPHPKPSSYDQLPTSKIKMTLLALLRDECEPRCPHSPKDLSTRSVYNNTRGEEE